MEKKQRLLPPSQALGCLSTHGDGTYSPMGGSSVLQGEGGYAAFITLLKILNKENQSLNTAQPGNESCTAGSTGENPGSPNCTRPAGC